MSSGLRRGMELGIDREAIIIAMYMVVSPHGYIGGHQLQILPFFNGQFGPLSAILSIVALIAASVMVVFIGRSSSRGGEGKCCCGSFTTICKEGLFHAMCRSLRLTGAGAAGGVDKIDQQTILFCFVLFWFATERQSVTFF